MTAVPLSSALLNPGSLVPSDGYVLVESRFVAGFRRLWIYIWPWGFLAAVMLLLLVVRSANPFAIAFGIIAGMAYVLPMVARRKRTRRSDQLCAIGVNSSIRKLLGGRPPSQVQDGGGRVPRHALSQTEHGLVLHLKGSSADEEVPVNLRLAGVSVEVAVGPNGSATRCTLRWETGSTVVAASGRLALGAGG
jgi:hypothetical protein